MVLVCLVEQVIDASLQAQGLGGIPNKRGIDEPVTRCCLFVI